MLKKILSFYIIRFDKIKTDLLISEIQKLFEKKILKRKRNQKIRKALIRKSGDTLTQQQVQTRIPYEYPYKSELLLCRFPGFLHFRALQWIVFLP